MRDSFAHLERRFCSDQRWPWRGGSFILDFILAFLGRGAAKSETGAGQGGAHLSPAAGLWQDVIWFKCLGQKGLDLWVNSRPAAILILRISHPQAHRDQQCVHALQKSQSQS